MFSLMITLSALAAATAPQHIQKRLHKPGRPPVLVQLAGPAQERERRALARETLSRPCTHSRRHFE